MDERFNVVGLRKEVEQLDGFNVVARCVWFCSGGHALGLQKNGEVARKRRGIAGKIDDLRRLKFREHCGCRLAEAGTRRIENYEVSLFAKLFQEFFRVEIVRGDGNASSFGIRPQISNCGKIRVNTDDASERFC